MVFLLSIIMNISFFFYYFFPFIFLCFFFLLLLFITVTVLAIFALCYDNRDSLVWVLNGMARPKNWLRKKKYIAKNRYQDNFWRMCRWCLRKGSSIKGKVLIYRNKRTFSLFIFTPKTGRLLKQLKPTHELSNFICWKWGLKDCVS